jgi:TatD DNase family protein
MIEKKDSPQHLEFLEKLEELDVFFTDTHAHIHAPPLAAEIENVVRRARKHKIARIITVGTDIADSFKALEAAEKFPNVFCVGGVHPHDAINFDETDAEKLRDIMKHPKMLGIGEIGLDFYYDHSPRDVQEKIFAFMLEIALETQVPVIIHNRDATDRTLDILSSILKNRDKNGIIHCYNGDMEILRRTLDMGFYISYAGPVTYKKADDLRETLKFVPEDRLLIETDSPYLAPSPFRGKTNEPANTIYTAAAVAEIIGKNLNQLAEILEANIQALFGEKL